MNDSLSAFSTSTISSMSMIRWDTRLETHCLNLSRLGFKKWLKPIAFSHASEVMSSPCWCAATDAMPAMSET